MSVVREKKIKFVFFGTPQVSVEILEALKKNNLLPSLVVTAPDKPKGRGMKLASSPVKLWAEGEKLPVLQPEKIDGDFIRALSFENWEMFVVVAYGKILPKELLDVPQKGSINLHYSLLPQLRGPAPVEGAILEDINPTGVSTILMDEKMDHGPILMQQSVFFEEWPLPKSKVFEKLNKIGGSLLGETVKGWAEGSLVSQEQDHEKATYVEMIKKEDALIDLNKDDYFNYRKILAYENNPKPYFIKNGKRMVINKTNFEGGKLEILRVTPEGKKEVDYKSA